MLRGENGSLTGEFWKTPGAKALQQLMRQENLRGLTDIIGSFDSDELYRGLKVLTKALIKMAQVPKEDGLNF